MDVRFKNKFFTSDAAREMAEKRLLEALELEAQCDDKDLEEDIIVDNVNNVERQRVNVDVDPDVPDGDDDDGDISAMFAARKKKVNREDSYIDVSVESAESVLKDYFSLKLEDLNLQFWATYRDTKKDKY